MHCGVGMYEDKPGRRLHQDVLDYCPSPRGDGGENCMAVPWCTHCNQPGALSHSGGGGGAWCITRLICPSLASSAFHHCWRSGFPVACKSRASVSWSNRANSAFISSGVFPSNRSVLSAILLPLPRRMHTLEFIPIKRQVPTEPGNPVLRCKCRKFLFPMVTEAW
jgi:hypothetical protein